MHRISILFLLCAIAAAPQTPTPEKAGVSGRVTSQNGEPLRRAVVRLLGKETYKQTVDSNGAFRLDGVAPGSYVLLVQRVGHSAQKYGASTPLFRDCFNAEDTSIKPEDIASLRQCAARAPGTTLSLAGGREIRDLTIKMTALGYISGRLTNQDGEPVPAWQVQAMTTGFVNGKRQLQVGRGGRTDADGYYSIGNLLPGKYVLRAYNQTGNIFGGLSQDRQGKADPEDDRTTYYPGAAEAPQATSVDVGPGAELTGMDIHLLRKRVYTVRGKVALPPGTAAGDQILNLVAKGASSTLNNTASAIVHPDGTFEFRGVDPGTYVIAGGGVMTRPGIPPPEPLTGHMEVTVSGADVEAVTMPLGGSGPSVAVAGTVTVEGARPATMPTVNLTDQGSASGNAAPDATGAFRFQNKFPPSRYSVNVMNLPAGVFVKSILYAQHDAAHDLLDLTAGGGSSLDVVLSSKVATVEGKVTNANSDAITGVVVSIWPRSPVMATDGGARFTSTDQNGHFEITDLGPGDYYAAAWEEIEPGLLRDTGFLTRFAKEAATFRLEESGHAAADVKLIARDHVASEVAKIP